MTTTKTKHGISISAKDVDTFQKADSILSLFNEEFIKKFTRCETTMYGHGILKIEADHYYHEKGIIIPADGILECIKIEPEEGKSCTVSVRFANENNHGIDIQFIYNSNVKITKFETKSVVDAKLLYTK